MMKLSMEIIQIYYTSYFDARNSQVKQELDSSHVLTPPPKKKIHNMKLKLYLYQSLKFYYRKSFNRNVGFIKKMFQ